MTCSLFTDSSAMEQKFLEKPSGSLLRRMRTMLPPDLLGSYRFFSSTPMKLQSSAFRSAEKQWHWDPTKQLYYSGKSLKSLAAAQRLRNPVIDDSKTDMVTYNTIHEISEDSKIYPKTKVKKK